MTLPPKNAETVRPADLLADLESRQDELLRLLSELEERTRQALSQFGGTAGEEPQPAVGTAISSRKAA